MSEDRIELLARELKDRFGEVDGLLSGEREIAGDLKLNDSGPAVVHDVAATEALHVPKLRGYLKQWCQPLVTDRYQYSR